MKEATKQSEKRCPVCAREYAGEDKFCGYDGALLEPQLITADHGGDAQKQPALRD